MRKKKKGKEWEERWEIAQQNQYVGLMRSIFIFIFKYVFAINE